MRCRECKRDWPKKYRERCPRCGSALVIVVEDIKLSIEGVEVEGFAENEYISFGEGFIEPGDN